MVEVSGQAGEEATAHSKAALSAVAVEELDTSNAPGGFNILEKLVLWDGFHSVKMLDTDAFWETYGPLFKKTRSMKSKP